ncbi:hypothetical protein T4E_4346 [Trichinella pseudospiralis]|uniref:Uncharacterized protein n=1 Tax=Trichinella pseudospiralis TaxID=6337 RepID=A0A0V0XA95_TRIPS|nr:hypothetical protein T4E_4346 [Trichinella pseudospiralis]
MSDLPHACLTIPSSPCYLIFTNGIVTNNERVAFLYCVCDYKSKGFTLAVVLN